MGWPKGRKRSEASKLKIQETLKRKYATGERAAASGMAGKKHSAETIARMKQSARVRIEKHGMPTPKYGSESHFWKGGVTKPNQLIRESAEYAKWRKAVFERDNYTCVLCGATKVKLNADHIKAFSQYPELRFDINNGRTLCEPCHRQTDNFGWKAKTKCA